MLIKEVDSLVQYSFPMTFPLFFIEILHYVYLFINNFPRLILFGIENIGFGAKATKGTVSLKF